MRVLMIGELPKVNPDSGLESHNLYVVRNLRQIDGLTLDFSSLMTEEIRDQTDVSRVQVVL
jgi:hypothetical protein